MATGNDVMISTFAEKYNNTNLNRSNFLMSLKIETKQKNNLHNPSQDRSFIFNPKNLFYFSIQIFATYSNFTHYQGNLDEIFILLYGEAQ